MPGDQFNNPIVANMGENFGEINCGSTFFSFIGVQANYNFTLIGPTNTDFDMILYDENHNYLDSANSNSYPDSIYKNTALDRFIIEIYAITGSGTFSLFINTYQETIPERSFRNLKLRINYGVISDNSNQILYYRINTTLNQNYFFNMTFSEYTIFNLEIETTDGEYSVIISGLSQIRHHMFNTQSDIIIQIYSSNGNSEF
ncbi:MAG: hypothetical protein OEY49_16390 [Candidatus Heimdallarchaeota archaeon]|nr:hypothetical protein [Candidatus Heimdallarchaeota archaeon]